MDRLLSLCLRQTDEFLADLEEMRCQGGAAENRAALDLIARLCPRGRPGIWFMPDEPVTSESLRKSGALVVPNQTSLDDDGADFVPNRANRWGDPIFALNPTVCVGLSHLIPVYADRSHCAKPLSGRYYDTALEMGAK